MDPEKQSPQSMPQNVSADTKVVIGGDVNGNVIVGDNNTVNQTFIQRIINVFQGDTEVQRAMRNRRAMLELVKNTWIKGVLEKSLYAEILIELGMEECPSAVEHPWDVQVRMPHQANHVLPTDTSIMKMFDEMNSAMLILGEPGSGKTTMLLELARDCIDRALQNDHQPIPVIFNLSSWDGNQSIDDWLVSELNTKYSVPKKTAENWVSNNDLSLLLDGLDEVKLKNREACVQAINGFRQKHGLSMPIAVCSRIADYETLNVHLNLQGAVLLQPLTTQQIEEYFERAGAELTAVRQALQSDLILQELVKQPLMLSLMTMAYRGVSVRVLTGNWLGTIEARRRHLFDIYIQQMFIRTARTKNELYKPEQTKLWLAWLAQKMLEYDAVPYLFENMQPKWLSQNDQWTYRLLFGSALGLLLGLGFGLAYEMLEGHLWGLVFGLLGFGTGFGVAVWRGFEKFGKRPNDPPNKIEMVDKLSWDWKQDITSKLAGVSLGLFSGTLSGLLFGWYFGLFYGMYIGLNGLILMGLSSKPISETIYPGQKLYYTRKNSLVLFILFGPIGGLLVGLFVHSFFAPIGVQMGLYFGLAQGLIMWVKYGGGVITLHYLLRFALIRNNSLPWKLVPFLNYCTDLIFLRRVGGGYIFVHRLLMEHFAAMYKENE